MVNFEIELIVKDTAKMVAWPSGFADYAWKIGDNHINDAKSAKRRLRCLQPYQALAREIQRVAGAGLGHFHDLGVHVEAGGTAEGDFLVSAAELQAAIFGESNTRRDRGEGRRAARGCGGSWNRA